MRKKLLYYLQKNDWIWSLPLGFMGFILYPILGVLIWGEGFAAYPPEFLHAAIYAALIMVIGNTVVQLGMNFNWRTVHRYIYNGGRKDFKESPVWLKLGFTLFIYVFYFVCFLSIWAVLV